MIKLSALLFSLGVFSVGCLAQTQVIKASAMIDVTTGKKINDPVIVIRDEKIRTVGRAGKVDIPEGAETIDLTGMTLLPGLMDMHVHLTSSASEHGYKRLSTSLPEKTIVGVMNAKKTLMAGFTTVRNLGAPAFSDVALRNAINKRQIPGPRIFAAGPAIGITGGHCDNNLLPPSYKAKSPAVADGPWEVRAKIRENVKYGADVIKVCATGGVLSKGTTVGAQQYSQEELNALATEANLRNLVTAAHAHGTEGIKAAIRAGINSIEHASLLDDEAVQLAIKHGTFLSMDIYTTEYILGEGEKAGILEESLAKERLVGGKQRESFTKAVEAGATVVFGSDAGVYPHGDNGKQFSRMVEFGMTSMQAIQAATLTAAKLLRQEDNIGSISAGKYADIIAVQGDPLENISLLEDVQFVMKSGEVFKQ